MALLAKNYSPALMAGAVLPGGSGNLATFPVGLAGNGATYEASATAAQIAINAAIAAADADGGGIVSVEVPGDYDIDDDISLVGVSNVILTGHPNARIHIPQGKRINVEDSENIYIHGFKTDSSEQTGGNGALQHNIRIYNSTNVHVFEMTIDAYAFGIFVGSATSISANPLQKVFIHDNYIYGRGINDLIGGGPVDTTSTFRDVMVVNNHVIQDFGAANSGTYFRAIDMVACKNVIVDGNICEGHIKLGEEHDPHAFAKIVNNDVRPPRNSSVSGFIELADNSESDNVSTHCLIANNSVTAGGIRVVGLSSQHTTFVKILGNTVRNASGTSDTASFPQRGIYVIYADNTTIIGNDCDANGVSASDGIQIADSLNVLVDENYVSGYAVGLQGAGTVTGARIGDNYLINCTATIGSALMTGVGNSIPNNYGINPNCLLYAQGNVTGATTFDRKNGDVITATLTGNITVTLSTTRVPNGSRMRLVLTQDGSGNHTVTWPSNFKKAGGTLTLSTAAAAVDVIEMEYNGTNWNEVSRSLNIS